MTHPDYNYCMCANSWEHYQILRGQVKPRIEQFCSRCSWDPCLCGEWERKYPPIVKPKTLFQSGNFTLHSGLGSNYKIECDALSDDDIAAIAMMIKDRLPPFGKVEGVPRGGIRLANELAKYARPYKEAWTLGERGILIVDDVFTTGMSMEEHRAGRDAWGAVIFSRNPTPEWIMPLWSLHP